KKKQDDELEGLDTKDAPLPEAEAVDPKKKKPGDEDSDDKKEKDREKLVEKHKEEELKGSKKVLKVFKDSFMLSKDAWTGKELRDSWKGMTDEFTKWNKDNRALEKYKMMMPFGN